jgi:hypothetical protein
MIQGVNKVVDLAKEGDGEAIEWLIKLIQDRIYALNIIAGIGFFTVNLPIVYGKIET